MVLFRHWTPAKTIVEELQSGMDIWKQADQPSLSRGEEENEREGDCTGILQQWFESVSQQESPAYEI